MSYRSELLSFDPNATNSVAFATYCPKRKPSFKAHTSRRLALSAFAFHYDLVAIYEWNNAKLQWEEIGRKDLESHSGVCDLCGNSMWEPLPIIRNWETYRYYIDNQAQRMNTGTYAWMRTRHGKLLEPVKLVCICKICFMSDRNCV